MPFSAFDDCNGSFTVALSIEENVFSIFILSNLNTLASGSFWEFSKKKRRKAHGFAWEYLRYCTGYGPGRNVKRHRKYSSLHSKKIFCL